MLTYADGGARVGRSSLSLSHVSVASSAQADGDELAGGGMLTYVDVCWRMQALGRCAARMLLLARVTARQERPLHTLSGAIGGEWGGVAANEKSQAPLHAY
jgi:hypothetical protein